MNRTITIEEAFRALNDLEIKTAFLSETDGYDLRRLSVVHKPAQITHPISYEVYLKQRQHDETDKVTRKEFDVLYEAVRFYNDMR